MFALKKLTSRHEVVMYACAMLSFLAVGFRGVGVLMGGIFLFSWVMSWLAFRQGWSEFVSAKIWNGIILATLFFTGAQMYLSDEAIINIGIRFILILLIIKLFSRKGGERDDWQIYALTFLLMAAGTTINEDIAYGIVFALYVFLGTFGLALLHLRTETERLGGRTAEPLSRFYVFTLSGLAGTVLVSSVAIFFAFPRVGLGFFATKSRSSMAMTGFSEQVELGSHGVIRNNPAVAMRVEFPDGKMPPDAPSFHWRMIGFDTYDGVQWLRDEQVNRQYLNVSKDNNREYVLGPLYSERLNKDYKDANTRSLKIYLEPLGVEQAPQLWPAKTLELPNSIPLPFNPSHSWLKYDPHYGDVYIEQRNEMGIIYELEAVTGPKPEVAAELEYEPGDLDGLQRYLKLPEGSERVVELSEQVTQGAKTPYDKARAIMEYLNANYSYTTDLPPVDKSNPVNSFLFDTKTGHCEFFATSTALMLRGVGVPTRLVNGFLGGVWNTSGDYMAVRQGDAHSWVEIYLPELGWVPIDPTPSEGTVPVQDNGIVTFFREVYDVARMNWMQWVVEYDLDKQLDGLRKLSRMLSPKSRGLGGSGGGDDGDEGEEEGGEPVSLIKLLPIILSWMLYLFFCWRGFANARRRSEGALGGDLGMLGRFIGFALMWLLAGAAWWIVYFESRTLGAGALGASGPLIAAFLGATLPRLQPRGGTARARGLYADFERAARRAGFLRGADEGPAQFIERLARERPHAARDLGFFKDRYLAMRFGGQEMTPEIERALKQTIKRLRKQLASTESAQNL